MNINESILFLKPGDVFDFNFFKAWIISFSPVGCK